VFVRTILQLKSIIDLDPFKSQDQEGQQFSGGFYCNCASQFSVAVAFNDSVHSFFSILLFVFIGFFEIFSAIAIRRNSSSPKWTAYFGFVAAMISFAFGVSFNFMNLFLGEWVIIAIFIAYIITLALSQSVHPMEGKLIKT
jgi:hypothetical protein